MGGFLKAQLPSSQAFLTDGCGGAKDVGVMRCGGGNCA